MRIWMLGFLLVLLIPIATVSAARTHPATGTGTVANVGSTVIASHKIGHNALLLIQNITYMLTGVLSGKAIAIERDLLRNVTDEGVTVMTISFHGTAVFTGTLNETRSGTLRVDYQGHGNSTFTSGRFTIFGGTGQLAGVHGQGSFRVSTTINYTLRWTVTTHHGENETGDRHHHED